MLSDLIPKESGPTLSAVQHFKWRHLQAGLIAIVVREFCIRKILIPTLPIVYSIGSKYVFQNLVYTFRLSIYLGMICCTEVESGPQGFMQALPESRCELCSFVGHYIFGYSM